MDSRTCWLLLLDSDNWEDGWMSGARRLDQRRRLLVLLSYRGRRDGKARKLAWGRRRHRQDLLLLRLLEACHWKNRCVLLLLRGLGTWKLMVCSDLGRLNYCSLWESWRGKIELSWRLFRLLDEGVAVALLLLLLLCKYASLSLLWWLLRLWLRERRWLQKRILL